MEVVRLSFEREAAPLQMDADGVCRVSGTRVPLETLLAYFQQGATAEEIADAYPSVPLADVYATIAYYLKHRDDVDAYLRHVEAEEAEVSREIRARFPNHLRERWLQRRKPVTL